MSKRQFLDYNGLELFWMNIQNRFASKNDAIKTGQFVAETDTIRFHPTQANGTTGTAIEFPMANHDKAGAISSDLFATIEQLKAGEGGLVPITGVQIEGTNVNLNNRVANIKLEYTEDVETGKSYLSLVDASPSNAEGVSKAISKIDVTSFVKTGLIKSADYDSEQLKIRLVFNTYENGVAGEVPFEIPVADFIDEYVAGEGINIDNRQDLTDNEIHQSEISVNRAQLDKRGAIRIAKANDNYNVATATSNITSNIINDNDRYIGVEVDKTDKAFVYVPWYNTEVTAESNGSHGLILSPDNSTLTNNISLGENTLASLALADSAMQTLKIVTKEVNKYENNTITKADFESMLDLKSASHVNAIKNNDFNANDSNDTDVPTCAAVKQYVSDTKDALIGSLDSKIDAGRLTLPGNTNYDDTDDYHNARDAKLFYTAITITDGKLVDEGAAYISIYDIADFLPLTKDDINAICGNITE